MLEKKVAAEKAMTLVQDGMTLGLGTGSTAYFFLEELGKAINDGLKIKGLATSTATEKTAAKFNIPLISLDEVQKLDLTIDGADEIDPRLQLIKGGGGALFREKIIAGISDRVVIIADSSKYHSNLGHFPLPVEVVPFSWKVSCAGISEMGTEPVLRMENQTPFTTDNGNYILDCQFDSIQEPSELHQQLKMVPGVVETGLFVDMANQVILGAADGSTQVFYK
ncbi:MAG: ribose-5-phosphate isomerase RpiA [Bacteroidota bacterium]